MQTLRQLRLLSIQMIVVMMIVIMMMIDHDHDDEGHGYLRRHDSLLPYHRDGSSSRGTIMMKQPKKEMPMKSRHDRDI